MNSEFMSLLELDGIEDRAQAATAGPWEAFVEGRDHLSGDSFIRTGGLDDESPDMYVSLAHGAENAPAGAADLDFIAHARQDIPALVARIRPFLTAVDGGRGPERLDREFVDVHVDYGNLAGSFVRLDLAIPLASISGRDSGGSVSGFLALTANEADELGQLLRKRAAEARTTDEA